MKDETNKPSGRFFSPSGGYPHHSTGPVGMDQPASLAEIDGRRRPVAERLMRALAVVEREIVA